MIEVSIQQMRFLKNTNSFITSNGIKITKIILNSKKRKKMK